MWLPHSFTVLLFAVLPTGALVNKTFDDSSSSFTFDPGWTAITPSAPCGGCASKPDTSQVNDGTYHDGNYRDGASSLTTGSFTFQGSAVYIFGIDQHNSQPNIVFTLGSIQQTHHYTGTERFVYHALFFSATGLASDQTHTVNWVFNLADTGVGVQVALFDYALVTSGEEETSSTPAQDPPSQPPSNPNTPSTNPSTPNTDPNTDTNTNTNTDANTNTDTDTSNNKKPVSISGSSSSAISTPVPSGSQKTSQSNSGTGHSQSGGSQLLDPTGSPVEQASSPTVTVSGLTTITAPVGASSKSKSNLAAIVGGIVAGLVVMALGILFVWHRVRKIGRRAKSKTHPAARIEGFPVPNTREVENALPVTTTRSKGFLFAETIPATPSTTSLLMRDDPTTNAPTASGPSSPLSIADPPGLDNVPVAPNRDLRLMEERLATLEAQIAAQQQPPPYIHDDDD